MIELTPSQTDYLKAVYFISKEGNITVTKIADFMSCSKPSVVRALKGLNELNLIIYRNTKIAMTDTGTKYAKNISRRDEVLKCFFKDVLGVDDAIATADANSLKYGVSCYTITKLEEYISKLMGTEINDNHDYCLCDGNKTLCTECINKKAN